jgi:hypothetical protein
MEDDATNNDLVDLEGPRVYKFVRPGDQNGNPSQDVVFPGGYTVASDGDTINLYYGAADSSIALARGSIRCLLAWLDANGHSEQGHDRRSRQVGRKSPAEH